MRLRTAEWSAEDLLSLPRLIAIARDLLRRQQDALIHGDVLRVERYHEALAKILTTLRGHLVRESSTETSAALEQLRNQMRTNRLLLRGVLVCAAGSAGGAGIFLGDETKGIYHDRSTCRARIIA